MSQSSNLFALVDKYSNRAVMLFDSTIKDWVEQNLSSMEIIEVSSIGSTNFSTKAGSISTVSITPKDTDMLDNDYHIIKRFPSKISLEEAYKLIS